MQSFLRETWNSLYFLYEKLGGDFLFFFFFPFIFISGRLIPLQYCGGFCQTLTGAHYTEGVVFSQ